MEQRSLAAPVAVGAACASESHGTKQSVAALTAAAEPSTVKNSRRSHLTIVIDLLNAADL